MVVVTIGGLKKHQVRVMEGLILPEYGSPLGPRSPEKMTDFSDSESRTVNLILAEPSMSPAFVQAECLLLP
jgi:hypothetical protein